MNEIELKKLYDRAQDAIAKMMEAIDEGRKTMKELDKHLINAKSKVYIVTETYQYPDTDKETRACPPSVFTSRKRANEYIKFCAKQDNLIFEDDNENYQRYSKKGSEFEILFEIHPTALNCGFNIFTYLG